jgi:hypothetical protein
MSSDKEYVDYYNQDSDEFFDDYYDEEYDNDEYDETILTNILHDELCDKLYKIKQYCNEQSLPLCENLNIKNLLEL